MHLNGLHDILPVWYKVASILATIPATSCSADRLSSIAVINIERKYANKTMQYDMQRIIDILGRRLEVIVLHTSFRAQMGTFYLSLLMSILCLKLV